MHVNDTDLSKRIQNGDQGAIVELWSICQRLKKRAVMLAGDDAEDLISDTFMQVLRQVTRGYVMRFPIGVCRVAMRREGMRGYVVPRIEGRHNEEVGPTIASEELSALDSILRRERLDRAAVVLRSMKPINREIVIRSYVEGEPREKTMAEMGITCNQYRLRKSRGKALITQRVAAVLGIAA